MFSLLRLKLREKQWLPAPLISLLQMAKREPLPGPPPIRSPTPPPNRYPLVYYPDRSYKNALTRTGPTIPWDPSEDAIVRAERSKQPPTPWSKISELVTGFGICPRSEGACSQRWRHSLQHDEPNPEQLTKLEVTLLNKAVEEVETGKEKWWCIAARYAELGKGKKVRALGKEGVKAWSELLRKRRKR